MNETRTYTVPQDGLEAYQQGFPMDANPYSERDDWAAWMSWGCDWCKGVLFDSQALEGSSDV